MSDRAGRHPGRRGRLPEGRPGAGPLPNPGRRARRPDGEEVLTLRCDGLVPEARGATFSPDGKSLVAVSSQKVRVWDAATGDARTLGVNGAQYVAFRPDGKQLAVGTDGYNSGLVLLVDAATGEVQNSFGQAGGVLAVAFSPDGKRLASAGKDRVVRVREVDGGKEVAVLRGSAFERKANSAHVVSVAYSPDGKWLASGTGSGTVDIWEAQTGKPVRTLEVHNQAILGLAFSPDSRRLATGTGIFDTADLKLWDVADGKEVLSLSGHAGYVSCVAFSPDGKWLASSAMDGTVKVWDLNAGKEALTLKVKGRSHEWIWTVAFSPDGKRLACGGHDRDVQVWELGN